MPGQVRLLAILAGVVVFFAGVSGLLVFLIAEDALTKAVGAGVLVLCSIFVVWKLFQGLARDHWKQEVINFGERESGLGTSWRGLFGNRSRGFWIGCVASFLLLVLWSAQSGIDVRQLSLPIILSGGLAGDWIGSRLLRVKGAVTQGDAQAKSLRRRIMLGSGVLFFVVNILPRTGLNGEYYWTSGNSIVAGIGAVLVVLAVVSKSKDEPF